MARLRNEWAATGGPSSSDYRGTRENAWLLDWSTADRRTIVGCIALALAAGASMMSGSILFNRPIFQPGIDFAARYAAGIIAAQGGSPYDTQRLLEVEQRLWPGLEPLPFFDPPPTAALFRVLAGLPMPVAAALWEVLTVLGIAALGVLLARTFFAVTPMALVIAVSLVAAFGPVRNSMMLGQVDVLFVLPFVAAASMGLRRGGSGPVAGAAAGLAVLTLVKPQLAALPVAVLLVFLVRSWPLRALSGTAASAAILLGLPAMLAPGASWNGWLAVLGRQPSDTSLTALWLRILAALLGLVGVLLVARAHVQRPRGRRGDLEHLLLLAICAGVLAAAVVRWNPQWCIALALPGAAVLAAWLRSGGGWSMRDRAALAVAVGTSLPNALGSFVDFGGGVLGVAAWLAVAGLVMVGVVLLRALPPRWALASWLVGAALLLEPLPYEAQRTKALMLALALLWLLPKTWHLTREEGYPYPRALSPSVG